MTPPREPRGDTRLSGTGIPACAARRFCRAVVFLSTICLLASCAIGPYAATPKYIEPNTRTTAARQLNEALAFGAVGVSEVAADELKLTWHEYRAITAKHHELINRELDFRQVQAVSRPEKPAENWELRVIAEGGQVTFVFKDGPTASKAEVDLRRLMRPLTENEQQQLARKYARILRGEVQQYLPGNGSRRRNPDWLPIDSTIDSLKLLTDQDFGEDTKAWQKFLAEHYDLGK